MNLEVFLWKECLYSRLFEKKKPKAEEEITTFIFFCYTYEHKIKQLGECHGTI